jgi:hypothetical protein
MISGSAGTGQSGGRVGTISADIHIDRPLEEVFAFAADQHNRARLLPDNFTDAHVLTGHSSGVGARLSFTIHMDRGSYESISEIVAHEPPHSFRERTRDEDTTYETEWRFAVAEGGTRVMMEQHYQDPARWTERLIQRIAGRRLMHQSLMVELIRLKMALEQPE